MKTFSQSVRSPQPVLLYDGECGLCNYAVRLLLCLDRHARLRFAPLQGATAQAFLRSRGLPIEDFDSMILVPDWEGRARVEPLFKTDAALGAAKAIGGIWGVAAWLRVVPKSLRDRLYSLIARSRYRLFGPYVPTPLPREEWQSRFYP